MKRERQNAILGIIANTEVDTQFGLIEELRKIGINTTQATLSRDIKDLHLIKELTAKGTYKYSVSNNPETHSHKARLRSIFKESVTSYTNAQNIVVLKTLPGLAPAACGAIDSMGIENIVGSIAGDDTGFLAMQDTASAVKFCKEIEAMFR